MGMERRMGACLGLVACFAAAAVIVLAQSQSSLVRAAPNVLFVSPSGTGTACTQAAPCGLQTARALAHTGDTLYVAAGVYAGDGDAVITLTLSLTLYGGWNGAPTGPVVRNPSLWPSTLDGQTQRRCVYIEAGTAPTVDGFTLTRGSA